MSIPYTAHAGLLYAPGLDWATGFPTTCCGELDRVLNVYN